MDQSNCSSDVQQKVLNPMQSFDSEIVNINGTKIQSSNNQRDENRFKLSTFDDLINPLRNDNPFGKLIDL